MPAASGQQHHLEITVRATARVHKTDLLDAEKFFSMGQQRTIRPVGKTQVHLRQCRPFRSIGSSTPDCCAVEVRHPAVLERQSVVAFSWIGFRLVPWNASLRPFFPPTWSGTASSWS